MFVLMLTLRRVIQVGDGGAVGVGPLSRLRTIVVRFPGGKSITSLDLLDSKWVLECLAW